MQTTSTNVSPSKGTVIYFEREILKHAGPVIVLDKFGLSKSMPKNKGVTIEFRRPNVFAAATVPLVEGVTPSSTQFTYSVVQATLRQYGQVVELTDVIEDTHLDPVLNDASVQCGENIGRTIEALNYGVLRAGTSVEYANGAARNAVNTPISLSKQRAVIRTLMANKAMKITRILDGSPDFNTRPVEAGFVGVGHTDVDSDIRNMQGFTPVAEYGKRSTLHDQEIGTVEQVRYILSPDLGSFADAGGAFAGANGNMQTTSGTSADVYPILYFGKEAYGTVALRGMGAVEPSIIPVGQKTKDDPLGQRGYIGWKTWHVCKILNEAWMVRLEVAVTDL